MGGFMDFMREILGTDDRRAQSNAIERRRSQEGFRRADRMADMDVLREIAGMPMRSASASQRVVRNRVVQVQRDGQGNVIGSTERYEETQFGDIDVNWMG